MTRHLTRRQKPHLKSESGAALIELAIVIPFLLILLVGTVDFGRVFYRGLAVAQASRAGAEFGAQSMLRFNYGPTDSIKLAAKNAVSTDLTLQDADITVTRTCECASESGSFSDTSPSNTCTGTPCAASPGTHLVATVSVTATSTFTTLISYPSIQRTTPITRTTRMRAE